LPATLAVDTDSILKQGVKDWQRSFSWPVSEPEFRVIRSCVNTTFEALIEALLPPWNRLIMADIVFKHYLIQHVHSAVVTARQTKEGGSVARTDRHLSPYREDYWQVGGAHQALIAAAKKNRAIDFARRRYRRFKYNPQSPLHKRIFGTVSGSQSWNLGALHGAKVEWMAQSNCVWDFPIVESVSRPSAAAASRDQKACQEIILNFLKDLEVSVEQSFGVLIETAAVAAAWTERLASLEPVYEGARQKTNAQFQYLVAAMGNSFIRAVSLGGIDAGATVTGVFHGHHVGYKNLADYCYIEFGACNEFIGPTTKGANSLRDVANHFEFTRGKIESFKSLETCTYHDLWIRHQGTLKASQSRNVMILGFPADDIRYSYGAGLFNPIRLDLEIRLCRTLRASGYKVLYKPHPSSINLSRALIQDEVDEFVTAPFEQSYTQADVLLFTYPETSTFGYALCLDVPMLLIDLDDADWRPKIYDLVSKRCVMVPAWFEDNCRIQFREAELSAAVEGAGDLSDFSYVFEYLIPENA
jgi:hypothetical protein